MGLLATVRPQVDKVKNDTFDVNGGGFRTFVASPGHHVEHLLTIAFGYLASHELPLLIQGGKAMARCGYIAVLSEEE